MEIDIGLAATILNHFKHRRKENWSVAEVEVPSKEAKTLPDGSISFNRTVYFVAAGVEEYGLENNPHAFDYYEARAIANAYLEGKMK